MYRRRHIANSEFPYIIFCSSAHCFKVCTHFPFMSIITVDFYVDDTLIYIYVDFF